MNGQSWGDIFGYSNKLLAEGRSENRRSDRFKLFVNGGLIINPRTRITSTRRQRKGQSGDRSLWVCSKTNNQSRRSIHPFESTLLLPRAVF